jgi:hypothetical protein
MSNRRPETTEVEWSDEEHDAIMWFHIVSGLTIDAAKRRVFEIRGELQEQADG